MWVLMNIFKMPLLKHTDLAFLYLTVQSTRATEVISKRCIFVSFKLYSGREENEAVKIVP